MRLLTDYEVSLVAGGTNSSDDGIYEQSIVVNGHSYSPPAAGWDPNVDAGIGGGGGGSSSSDWFESVLENVINPIYEAIVGHAVKTAEQQEQDERTIANQFNTQPYIAMGTYITNNYHAGTVWYMADGTEYLDTNGNGRPDIHAWFAEDGHLYGNDGSGTMLIH